MGTTAQKLQAIANSKAAIKAAIEAKGVSDVGNKLSDYATKIASIPQRKNGLSFTNITSQNTTVKTSTSGTPPSVSFEYSMDDGITWTSYTLGSDITIPVGGTVLFRAGANGNATLATDESNFVRFSISPSVKTNGKIQYLLRQDGQPSSTTWAFCSLFRYVGGLRGTIDLSDIGDGIGTHGLQRAFGNNTSVANVDLSGLNNVPDFFLSHAFTSSNVENVYVPNITSLGYKCLDYAFANTKTIKYISFPSLTTIGETGMVQAFFNCTALKEVHVPKCSSVGMNGLNQAFSGCTALKEVHVPKCSSVGMNGLYQAFSGCTALEVVDFSQATAIPTMHNTNTFQNTNNTFKIVVPDALYSTWIAATNWSTYSSQIVKASEYTPAS